MDGSEQVSMEFAVNGENRWRGKGVDFFLGRRFAHDAGQPITQTRGWGLLLETIPTSLAICQCCGKPFAMFVGEHKQTW